MEDETVEEQAVRAARKTEPPSGRRNPCGSSRELITCLDALPCADIEKQANHNSELMEG